jgi:hypothetical protein
MNPLDMLLCAVARAYLADDAQAKLLGDFAEAEQRYLRQPCRANATAYLDASARFRKAIIPLAVELELLSPAYLSPESRT